MQRLTENLMRLVRNLALASTTLAVYAATLPSAAAQSLPKLTPQDCDRLEIGMTEAEIEAVMEDLDIEPDRETTSAGNSLWRWIDDENGALLLAVLRNGTVAQLSCFGVNPTNAEDEVGHQLCEQIEMGMTLPEVRQALGSPGTMVQTNDPRANGLLWQWEDGDRNELAILAFSSFGILASRTCIVTPPAPTTETPSETVEEPETDPLENAIDEAEILPVVPPPTPDVIEEGEMEIEAESDS